MAHRPIASTHLLQALRRRSGWVLAALVLALFGVALFATAPWGPGGSALPRLGRVAPFQLVDQEGRPFTLASLEGRTWIAGFVFTRCPTICPRTTATMARVQERTREAGDQLRLVSFSVDPEHDDPPRLRAYGQRFRADFTRWSFLTGPLESVREAVVKGLHVSMEGRATDEDVSRLLHGTRFVLVDPEGEIRGYYVSEDASEVERLSEDALRLAAR